MPPASPGPGGHVRELHPTGIFAAVGRFDYRFRRWLPLIGLVLLIGTNVWAATSGGTLIQGGWVIDGSEERRAAAVLADRFGSEATTMLVVYRDPDRNAASPEFQATVKRSLDAVATDDEVTKVQTYGDTGAPALLWAEPNRIPRRRASSEADSASARRRWSIPKASRCGSRASRRCTTSSTPRSRATSSRPRRSACRSPC